MNVNNLLPIMQTSIDSSYLIAPFSKIVPEDKFLLEKSVRHFRPESKQYEDSWGYIVQATRHGGFKWYDPETESLIFFGRKFEEDETLVIPMFFSDFKYLTYVINKIERLFNVSNTILKNVSLNDISKLASYGFRSYKKNESWGDFARFDDQTYPQLLVDLQSVILHKGQQYRTLRNSLRKELNVHIRPYCNEDKEKVLLIFAAIDGTLNRTLQEQKQGMYYGSHIMYPDADVNKFVIVRNDTNEILGFTAFSSITTKTAASVASLFKPRSGDVNIWGAYHTLLEMYKMGYKQINFGGCETKGTYLFLREKFRPTEEISKTHLVYDEQS